MWDTSRSRWDRAGERVCVFEVRCSMFDVGYWMFDRKIRCLPHVQQRANDDNWHRHCYFGSYHWQIDCGFGGSLGGHECKSGDGTGFSFVTTRDQLDHLARRATHEENLMKMIIRGAVMGALCLAQLCAAAGPLDHWSRQGDGTS